MPRDAETRAFLIHLTAYAGVNIGLAALNLMETPAQGEARELWFVWPLAGWGIGVVAHGMALLLARQAPGTGVLANPDMRGVAIHLFVYLAVNLLLIAANLTASPHNIWFIWPLAGWGVGVAAHAFMVYRQVVSGIEREQLRLRGEQAIAAAARATLMPPPAPPAPAAPAARRAPARRKSKPAAKRKPAGKKPAAKKAPARKAPAKKAPARRKGAKKTARRARTRRTKRG